MATRSTIAMRTPEGTIRSIYCHWDGYPDGVGATLNVHYTDPIKTAELISLGDLSSLHEEIGTYNDFGNPTEGICLFYGRDRGETGVDAITHDTVDEWIAYRNDQGCEYGYLLSGGVDNDFGWLTFNIPSLIEAVNA
jgi:hypothetical protein